MMENTRSLSNLLTIVIPSKNESKTLYDCIHHISNQTNITGTRIVIADISNQIESLNYIRRLHIDFSKTLNIRIIKGGYPAYGRLQGSKWVNTPYMLFLDSDVFLTNPNTLMECMEYNKDLLTVPFHTDKPYGWVFRMFDVFQYVSTILGTPFAVGGFQLWKTETYWSLGGYNPEELFAEDYSISQKVNPKNFKVHRIKGTYTSSRRFKSKGIVWMFNIMLKSYFNRNNPDFFKKSHGYWD
jgi:glycosyltransferase involved in cell wall biosynthesis